MAGGADDSPPRRRLSAAARRETLLDAALTEFSRRGYHLTQMDHVATTAGVSKALLYQHFVSKESLFTVITTTIVDDFTVRLTAAIETPDTSVDRVRGMVAVTLDYVTERPEAWSVVLRHLDNPELGDELKQLRERFGGSIAEAMVARVEALQGPAARRSVTLLVPLIVGAIFGITSWWLEHPDVPRHAVEAMAANFIWLGLERVRAGERLPRPDR